MEYSVGSLAELISGVNTPNKPKIVVQKFKKAKKTTESEPSTKARRIVKKGIKSNSPQKKHIKRTFESSYNESVSNEGQSPPKKPKLSKNDQNAINRIKNKVNKETKSSEEYTSRTIYVGNVPIIAKKKKFTKFFSKYGDIETVRFRGIPVKDIKTPKKVAAIKKEFHPDRNTKIAFIRFKSSEDAKKAEDANGELFEEHHLRVQCCELTNKYDESKAIFIGNLNFSAEEEELWNLFGVCGPISHVRIVRDGRTGMGKGFGYVNFKDVDAVQLALEMGKITLNNRELRISVCNAGKAKKKSTVKGNTKTKINREENGKKSQSTKGSSGKFAGTKFTDKKKKTKFSKNLKAKKKLAEKLVGVKNETNK